MAGYEFHNGIQVQYLRYVNGSWEMRVSESFSRNTLHLAIQFRDSGLELRIIVSKL